MRTSWGNFAPPVTPEHAAAARRELAQGGRLLEPAALLAAFPFSEDRLIPITQVSTEAPPRTGRTLLLLVLALGAAAVGVNVAFEVAPGGLVASFGQQSGVTDASGIFATSFTADVTVPSRFLVTVRVSKSGYEPEHATRSIEVSPRPATGAPSTPALDTLSMVAIVAGLAGLYGWRQRRRWIARKP